ncbi:MAG: Mut7-C RNAse domain-containing protein [Candidatus Bathyarchaeia archaeon]
MKFIADGMLGKLSRWLRMLGYDVKYTNKLDDNNLTITARKERRILLTRDLELYQQATAKGVEAFYVRGENEAERLAEIAEHFGISLSINLENSRCPKCNTKLCGIQKEEVKDKVEKNTYVHYEKFWSCPKCSQIYWQGAHWSNIQSTLKTAKEKFKEKID